MLRSKALWRRQITQRLLLSREQSMGLISSYNETENASLLESVHRHKLL